MTNVGNIIFNSNGIIDTSAASNNQVLLSPSCLWNNWSGYTLSLSGHAGVGIEFFNGKWYVPRYLMPGPIRQGLEQIKTTSDITNPSSWTVAYYTTTNSMVFNPAFSASNPNGIVFIGDNTGIGPPTYWNILYSPDGTIWSGVSFSIDGGKNTIPETICASPDKFVMDAYLNGTGNYYIYYSTDMINWIYSTGLTSVYRVRYVGEYFYILFENKIAKYSTDGIDWKNTTINNNFYINDIAYLNGKYVGTTMYSSPNTNIIAYSYDGINFLTGSTIYSGGSLILADIYSAECLYIGYIYSPVSGMGHSPDGITWYYDASISFSSGYGYGNNTIGYGAVNYKTRI